VNPEPICSGSGLVEDRTATQFHLQSADVLKQLRFLDLAIVFLLTLLPRAKEFTGPLKQLFLARAPLDWMRRMVGCNLLKSLAAADCFHRDLCLEF
jgi:hypothetical protein